MDREEVGHMFENYNLNSACVVDKNNKLVGMIQPKLLKNKDNEIPQLHEIGCMGKITSFKETEETRYLIELKGIIRFKVINEIDTK